MFQLFKLGGLVYFGALLAVIIATLMPELVGWLTNLYPEHEKQLMKLSSVRVLLSFVSMIAFLLLLKPVWRWLWKLPFIGPFLCKKVFPDLNGTWNVEVRSNYPIIDRLRHSAKSGIKFDLLSADEELPGLRTHFFKAKITQNWDKVRISLESDETDVMKDSITLTCALLQATEYDAKRIAYVYDQTNKLRTITDTEKFPGAAILNVSENGLVLEGHYWTKRSWEFGMNTAGTIKFTKAI